MKLLTVTACRDYFQCSSGYDTDSIRTPPSFVVFNRAVVCNPWHVLAADLKLPG
jgi:hypothetical protein